MRTIAIGILALLASGCAAGREFDLVPRDPQAPWQVGDHRVWTESSRASVSMAFDRPWNGYLVFNVEIVNQSTSVLHVDPTHFSYSLASSDGELPTKLEQRFAALAPETALPHLKKQLNIRSGVGAITSFVAGLVVLTAIAVNAVEFGDYSSSSCCQGGSGDQGGSADQGVSGDQDGSTEQGGSGDYWKAGDQVGYAECVQAAPAPPEMARFEPVAKPIPRILDQASKSLLHVTDLAPGATVRGELWMPAWPVQHAVGPEKMRDDNSITTPKKHAATYQGLTLRVPAEVGGQEFDYSIAVE